MSPHPELPHIVPDDQRQTDGGVDPEPVYQTHRGPKREREDAPPKPSPITPDGPLRR